MGDLIPWPIHIGSKKLKAMKEERKELMRGPSMTLSCTCGVSITVYEKGDIKAYPFRIFHTIHKKCVPDMEYWGY